MNQLSFTVINNQHKPFTISAQPGQFLLETVNQNYSDPKKEGIPFICKKGACRGCIVQIAEGHSLLVPPSRLEQRSLQVGKTTIAGGYRLACLAKFKEQSVLPAD